ncbi:MAG TPA: hypothetical protein VIN71_00720 [Pseudomonadales bacterium]
MPQHLTPRLRLTRRLFALCGPCALLIGSALLLMPQRLAGLLAIDHGNDTVLATLYAAVLIAVGLVCLAGWRQPQRHASLLLLVGSYKGIAASTLLARYCLADTTPLPLAALLLALAYALMAAISLWLYHSLQQELANG